MSRVASDVGAVPCSGVVMLGLWVDSMLASPICCPKTVVAITFCTKRRVGEVLGSRSGLVLWFTTRHTSAAPLRGVLTGHPEPQVAYYPTFISIIVESNERNNKRPFLDYNKRQLQLSRTHTQKKHLVWHVHLAKKLHCAEEAWMKMYNRSV